MGKYIRNGIAYLRGLLLIMFSKVNKNRTVETNVRVFASSALDFDKGAIVRIGKGSKIRERAVISVRKNGTLVIGNKASIGMDCKITVHENVTIGEGTLLSPNVLIYDHDHVFDKEKGVHRKEFITKPVVIGKNCWIGSNSVIIKGTVIGDNCVIGAGCIVNGNIASGSVLIQKRTNTIK